MSDTVLLTGATGHLGRWLALEHLRQGDAVLALLRRPAEQGPELAAWLASRGAPTEAFRAVGGDLGAEGLGLTAAAREVLQGVTRVAHFGALWGFGLPVADVRRVNVGGARALLSLAATLPRLRHAVHASGYMATLPAHLAALGIRADGTADWARVYRRTGAYEASKLEAHFAVRAHAAALGLPLTVVHPATATGHSRTGEILGTQALTDVARQLLSGRLLAVPGSPRHRLPLVAVDHLAAWVARVPGTEGTAGRDFLLMDPDSPPLVETVGWLARGAGVAAPRRHVPLALLRAALAVPGVARATGLSAEGLPFLRTEALDPGEALALGERLGVHRPPLFAAVEATGRFLAQGPAQRRLDNASVRQTA
jgi:thioester reductase-like protein